MIHVSAAECVALAEKRIGYFSSRHGNGIDFGGDENRKRDLLGARGEIAFCKHLEARGIEHIHNHIGYGTPDVVVKHRGISYMVDVKASSMFGPNGNPRKYGYTPGHCLERMKRESWFIVIAAVHNTRVWLTKGYRPEMLYQPYTGTTGQDRKDYDGKFSCRFDSLDWCGKTWREVLREATE
jgi:hypothetical protein